jgi:hypothetical protein
MKRQWDIEELIEHFTLIKEDEDVLANTVGATGDFHAEEHEEYQPSHCGLLGCSRDRLKIPSFVSMCQHFVILLGFLVTHSSR